MEVIKNKDEKFMERVQEEMMSGNYKCHTTINGCTS